MPQILLLATFEGGRFNLPQAELTILFDAISRTYMRKWPSILFSTYWYEIQTSYSFIWFVVNEDSLFRVMKFDKRFLCCFIKSSEIKILTRNLSFISGNQISAKFKMKIDEMKTITLEWTLDWTLFFTDFHKNIFWNYCEAKMWLNLGKSVV